jgi:hypothetical protein
MPPPEQVERARAQIPFSVRAERPASSGGAVGEDAHDGNVRFVVEPVQR